MGHLNEHMIEIIKEAIDLEINAKKFYEYAAEVTRNERGKEMFERLAAQEGGHMDEVGAIFTAITGSDDWQVVYNNEIQTVPASAIVESFKATVASWVGNRASADDTVALRLAMELERRAIRYFEGLAKLSDDPQVHALAERLAEEEQYHYDLLQSQHDSILQMGMWMDTPEFRMDGKF